MSAVVPTFIYDEMQDIIEAPLKIEPPGGFPVQERVSPDFSATITYERVVQSKWLQWIEQHQKAILATAAGLMVLAIMTGGRRRR